MLIHSKFRKLTKQIHIIKKDWLYKILSSKKRITLNIPKKNNEEMEIPSKQNIKIFKTCKPQETQTRDKYAELVATKRKRITANFMWYLNKQRI